MADETADSLKEARVAVEGVARADLGWESEAPGPLQVATADRPKNPSREGYERFPRAHLEEPERLDFIFRILEEELVARRVEVRELHELLRYERWRAGAPANTRVPPVMAKAGDESRLQLSPAASTQYLQIERGEIWRHLRQEAGFRRRIIEWPLALAIIVVAMLSVGAVLLAG